MFRLRANYDPGSAGAADRSGAQRRDGIMADIMTKLTRGRPFSQAVLLIAVLALLPAGESAATETWTKGHRKILVIPIRFTDPTAPSDAPDPNGVSGWGNFTNGTTTTQINSFFLRQSYNQFSVDFTILPPVDMGVHSSYYTNQYPGSPPGYTKWTEWAKPGSLADDARAKARAIGLTNGQAALYESANYDLDIIAGGYNIYMTGASSDGGRTVLAFNFNALPHELCHCLGLQHANGTSRASGYSPVKGGSYFFDAYGDIYCLMGYKMNTRTTAPPPDRDINPYFKYELGWLSDANILNASTSGMYRIHAFDQGSLNAGANYAMRIVRDSSYTYWFDFRQAITNLPDSKWSMSGLEVHYGGESPRATSGTTMLWDTTPGSRGCITTNFIGLGPSFATMHDAPLQCGRTYSDTEANLHVTPVKKGGTTPESLDVVVNFGPFQPTNRPPTVSILPASITVAAGVTQVFAATASDPDGDTLSYYWEFDDDTSAGGTDFGGLNADSRLATTASHSWSRNGDNFVRCTVSDMRGGTMTYASTVTVTNGAPAPVTITGIITNELGIPLQGAVVNNYRSGVAYGSTNFAGSSETAADGKYRISVPINNYTYTLSVGYKGYTNFVCSRAGGTVPVSGINVSNVNFGLVRRTCTISGGVYTPGGWGYDSASDGNLSISNSLGQSQLVSNGFWQMSIPDGTLLTLTATATNPACTVAHDFPNPYMVVDDVNTLAFFVDIPGSGPHAGFASSGTNSDDTAGTVYIPVTMTLPAGRTNWVQDQYFSYRIEDTSTAEYGVDYKAAGGQISFYKNMTPSPLLIPLTVIRNMVPKSKTIILTLAPASSIAALGPITTYTYTIVNPGVHMTGMQLSGGTASFGITNLYTGSTNYVLRSHDLLSPAWTTTLTFSAASRFTNWSEPFSNQWTNVYYRITSR